MNDAKHIHYCITSYCGVGNLSLASWTVVAFPNLATRAYCVSRDLLLHLYVPIQPYIKFLSLIWTLAIILSAAVQALKTFPRSVQLPKPATEGQNRRFKIGVPISWWATAHIMFKAKQKGYMIKLGISFRDLKLLVVVDKSKGAAVSIRRQIKFYGAVSKLKVSSALDR